MVVWLKGDWSDNAMAEFQTLSRFSGKPTPSLQALLCLSSPGNLFWRLFKVGSWLHYLHMHIHTQALIHTFSCICLCMHIHANMLIHMHVYTPISMYI